MMMKKQRKGEILRESPGIWKSIGDAERRRRRRRYIIRIISTGDYHVPGRK